MNPDGKEKLKQETLDNILQQLVILNQQTAIIIELSKKSMRTMGIE